MSVEYSFSVELYAQIRYCDMQVHRSCIMVGIQKRTSELWPRLLRVDRRPTWLTLDVEHSAMTSSDEEGDSDDKEPLKLLTRLSSRISLLLSFPSLWLCLAIFLENVKTILITIIISYIILKTLVIVQCFNLVLIHESFVSAYEEPDL